jgi:Mg2+ and Co2+ transporter CorA
MNVDLPFQTQPYAFWLTVGISAVFIGIAAIIFYRRDWF